MVTQVAAPPYDVLNSQEAKEMASEKSLLHITRPEIDFDPMPDEHDDAVYARAVENFRTWQQRGWLVRDPKPCYYIYAQTMDGRTQYGLVFCAHIDDYASGAIKRHELTRRDKEDDRMRHVRIQNANIEPVFFSYKDDSGLASVVESYVMREPEYDFTDEHGFGHRFWVIDDDDDIARVTSAFETRVDALYIADGHHRTAAAARVGEEKKAADPGHTGDEEYNYFMAVGFPASQLRILDYNRVVRDLAGMDAETFLSRLSEDFTVESEGSSSYRPAACTTSPCISTDAGIRLRQRTAPTTTPTLSACWTSRCSRPLFSTSSSESRTSVPTGA